ECFDLLQHYLVLRLPRRHDRTADMQGRDRPPLERCHKLWWCRRHNALSFLFGRVEQYRAVLGHNPVKQRILRERALNAWKTTAGHEYQPPTGTLEALQSLERLSRHDTLVGNRSVVIGSKCEKVHCGQGISRVLLVPRTRPR